MSVMLTTSVPSLAKTLRGSTRRELAMAFGVANLRAAAGTRFQSLDERMVARTCRFMSNTFVTQALTIHGPTLVLCGTLADSLAIQLPARLEFYNRAGSLAWQLQCLNKMVDAQARLLAHTPHAHCDRVLASLAACSLCMCLRHVSKHLHSRSFKAQVSPSRYKSGQPSFESLMMIK